MTIRTPALDTFAAKTLSRQKGALIMSKPEESQVLQELDKETAKKLNKAVKKSGLRLGLREMLGAKVESHCTTMAGANDNCWTVTCAFKVCSDDSCDHLSCSSKTDGTCVNRQCSGSACDSGAGWGPACDTVQCSNSSCSGSACKSKACVSKRDGLCGSKLCKSSELGHW